MIYFINSFVGCVCCVHYFSFVINNITVNNLIRCPFYSLKTQVSSQVAYELVFLSNTGEVCVVLGPW